MTVRESRDRPGLLPGVILDGEGVVFDTEQIWDEAQTEFLARRGIAYDRARVKPVLAGRSGADGMAFLQRTYNIPGDPGKLLRERVGLMRERLSEVKFMPGFPDFFQWLRSSYPVALATAMAPDLLELVNKQLKLRQLFGGHVYTLDDVAGKAKPAPDLFLHACRKLHRLPAQCVVVEDSPTGLAAAHSAGMLAIGLATTFMPVMLSSADRVARDLGDVRQIISAMNAADGRFGKDL